MPPPRLTPAQRTFGVGLAPTYDIFRPPEGMELDPAYSPATRQQQGMAMTADLQRQAFKDAADEQQFARQQRDDERRMQQVEQQATEALRGRNPEEIPNILAQFPELARSRNLGGFTNFAQAVTPSAGQKTLASGLRMKLSPEERAYFDADFPTHGDSLRSFDNAQKLGAHDKWLADLTPHLVAAGATPEDYKRLKEQRDLGTPERALEIEQWKSKAASKKDFRDEPMQQWIKARIDALPEPGEEIDPVTNQVKVTTIEDVAKMAADITNTGHRMFHPEKYQQASVAPQAGAPTTPAVQPTSAPTPAVEQPAIQNVDLSKIPYSQREQYVKDLEEQAKEGEKINRAWFDAQKDLQSKLEKEIGTGNIGNTNYSKLRSFAEAVLADETTPTGELGTGGEYRMDVPVGFEVLKKIGLKPSQAAFSEPGNRRTGTQNVTYEDLLKTWAKNYLGTAPVTATPQIPAIPNEEAAKSANLLNKYIPATKG